MPPIACIVFFGASDEAEMCIRDRYKTYLPTEDELKRELRLDSFHKLDE